MLYECCVCNMWVLWVRSLGYYACSVWQHMYFAHMCSTISILCALYWYCVWICRFCVCVLKTCVQCVDSVDTVWVLWVSLCFPSLTGACSWKHGFRPSILMYCWAWPCGPSVNPKACKPSLLHSDWASEATASLRLVFHICKHALGTFPRLLANSHLGSMSHRKGLHPGKCLGVTSGH